MKNLLARNISVSARFRFARIGLLNNFLLFVTLIFFSHNTRGNRHSIPLRIGRALENVRIERASLTLRHL